ncbi:MAG: Alpha-L-fucosidase [Planctomycetes bacterium ADurb.Bin126]|nr:MAG: Alpha-L-fucosidase [Planctomycetes bacterium ADurb.Bin126]HQL75940.1 alpha-L-fucosidase [Phycisphaerae bacterium]
MKNAMLISVLVAVSACSRAADVDMSGRAQELKGLRWGMFICWSFSTFSGKEWTPGVKDVSFFKATGCDTDQWARTAREAGMGYILFLTKHHDGFCLWDTKTTDRKVTKAPLGRDVLAELKKSCDKHGIKLALYFSEGEWDWPNKPDGKRYQANGGHNPGMKKAHLKELLTQYGPIEYIWFDHAIGDGGVSHKETIAFVKALQPGCFVGFNHGDQAGADIRLGEMGRPGPLADHKAAGPHMRDAPSSSYLLAEFTYPILPPHKGGAMWFYSLPQHDNLCKSAESIYRDYLGAVQYGNIFSLDVGPDYAGKLREIDVRTLREVGRMIREKAALPEPPRSLAAGKAAKSSSTWPQPGYEADKAFDGNESTRWGAAADARSGWIEVDLGPPTRIGRAMIVERSFPRTREYAIEYLDGEQWKPLHRGTRIESDKIITFPPVTAQRVRLNVLKAVEVPTIEEFQLFVPQEK